MIAVIEDFVNGPFELENPYKRECVAKLQSLHRQEHWLCIETSETEVGMPDTVRLGPSYSNSILVEYKLSNAAGTIKFEKDQPRWYKRHTSLTIYIIAWDRRYGRSVIIDAQEIVKNGKLSFNIPNVIDRKYSLEKIRMW
jgi:hypothetical protein